jgi:hypothetical protein
MEDIYIKVLGYSPAPPRIGIGGYSFINYRRCTKGKRPVNDVRMPGNPPDISQTPVYVFRMNILDIF